MKKIALISKHIVIIGSPSVSQQFPVAGVILISNETIEEVAVVPNDQPFEFEILSSQYSDYQCIDYSDYYISPGMIDLNVRKEWEDYSQLTFSAVSGGVSLIVVEDGYYNNSSPNDTYYCDIGKVLVVNETTDFLNIPQDVLALKGYLYQPAPKAKSISNLQFVINQVHQTKLPFFIDPTLPDPRMLYMASPLRLEAVEERKLSDPNSSNFFAAAFSEDVNNSESSSSSEMSEENPPEKEFLQKCQLEVQTKRSKMFTIQSVSLSDDELENMHDEIPDDVKLELKEAEKHQVTDEMAKLKQIASVKRRSMSDIYSEIDSRIKASQQNFEDLCRAEKSTYSYSGSTSFLSVDPVKKCSSLSISPIRDNIDLESQREPVSAQIYSNSNEKRKIIRPPPIQIKVEVRPEASRDYKFQLANYPEHWETAGIDKVAECLTKGNKIHFVNISSANALNKVRQLQTVSSKITNEIPAIHLYFTSESVKICDTRFKNTPPIRGTCNYNLVWDLLKMKGIFAISSQHAMIDPTHKLSGNFQQALNGISSLGLTLQSVWTKLNSLGNSEELLENYIVRLSKWMSFQPAKVLGLSKKRGSIEKGKFADLVVWDPKGKSLVGKENVYRETTPLLNEVLYGKIHVVYIKGKIAYESVDIPEKKAIQIKGFPVGAAVRMGSL